MQEEIEHKSVAMSFQAAKLTARVLAKAMSAVLRQIKKAHDSPKTGDQSFKRLDRTISGETADIEVVGRIKSFERYARKYGVSYRVERNAKTSPSKWTVYFKSKQACNMTGAFQEYSAHVLSKSKKPTVREAMRNFRELAKDRVQEHAPKQRERSERSGPER